MKEILVLEENDIIEPHDLVRKLYSYREEIDEETIAWREAKEAMPYWVGKTLKAYFKKGGTESFQIMRVPDKIRKQLNFRVLKQGEISLGF